MVVNEIKLMQATARRSLSALVYLAMLMLTVACSVEKGTDTLPLKTMADIPLPGAASRWDYASIDEAKNLLFMAHLGDSAITIFDLHKQKVMADIRGISSVHGVIVIPELGRIYATATGTNEVIVIDEKTLQIMAHIPTGDHPDGLAYAPDLQKLYVSDELGGTDTVIDVRTNRRIATIQIGGKIGNTQYDPLSRHIMVNAQTRRQLVVIDPVSDKLIKRIDLPGAAGNHGLYIDAPARLAFIACENNAKLLVLDLVSDRIVSIFNVGPDPDVLAFDATIGRLYVAGEVGVVSVFKLDHGAIVKLGQGRLAPDAHVVAVDRRTHWAYFPLKNLNGKSVLRITVPIGWQ